MLDEQRPAAPMKAEEHWADFNIYFETEHKHTNIA